MKSQRFARKHCRRIVNAELDKALKRDPRNPDLLALKGSIGDTLLDSEILELLAGYNATGKVIHTPQ